MIVFCPGCGSRISVQPESSGGAVQCPRCQSKFSTAGLKPADDLPQPKRFRAKKAGRGKLGGVLITLAVLILLGGGAAALYFGGVFRSRTSTTGPERAQSGNGKTARPGWKEFESSEAHVRALLPGEPKRASRRTKDVAYELEKDGVAYGIVFADLDQAKVKDRTPEQIIQQQHEQWAAGSKGKLVSEKEVAAGTYRGKEFVVDLPRGKAYMRYFAAGRRLYTVMVVGNSRPPDPADVAALFDSFEITG